MSGHRCTDTGCTYLGQRSPKACLCHKTDTQVLTKQRDELLEALDAALEWAEEERRRAETSDLGRWIARCDALETVLVKARTEMTGDAS